MPVALAIIVEGGFALVRHVELFQGTELLLRTARTLYLERRSMIQFMPECARYDPDTTYTLRPGICRFSNDEFDTEYRINSAGLRDDEASLDGPEIVVIGDSYAMGWGVEQDETIASVLEHTTGLRTLNAAVSSWGTVRELRILARIDTSKMRYLVIQYAANDHRENTAYMGGGNRLQITSGEGYEQQTLQHTKKRSYYPGAYTVTRIRAHLQGMRVGRPHATRIGAPIRATEPTACATAPRIERPLSPPAEEQVEAFVHALATSPVDLGGVTVVVVAVSTGPEFTEGLRRTIESGQGPALLQTTKACDMAPLLSDGDFFRLDDHLTAQGHAIVAEHVRALAGL